MFSTALGQHAAGALVRHQAALCCTADNCGVNGDQALGAAVGIAAAVGEGQVQLKPVASQSSHVFLGPAEVIKVADDPARFDREIALAMDLPHGIGARVLDRGEWTLPNGEVAYYVRVARLPGYSPMMGLPNIDRSTAQLWARQATTILKHLHGWQPSPKSMAVFKEPLNHGGFTSRATLQQVIDAAERSDTRKVIPAGVFAGLRDIAYASPERAAATVPVHADCHWENWLVDNGDVVALLDFEWARYGEPADDWMFLARFSGHHMVTVLETVADLTGARMDMLRGACEAREASYLVNDLLLSLRNRFDLDQREAHDLVPDLIQLSVQRAWRQ